MSKKFKKSSRNRRNYIIGIDEVGRGALAGPVTVVALALQINIRTSQVHKTCDVPKLKDSKKLSSKQREEWFKWIKKHTNKLENVSMFYAVKSVSPKIIDKINISQAANLAATNALRRLIQNSEFRIQNYKVYLDGGLYINKSKIKNQKSKLQLKNIKIKTVIKGDEKIKAISLASIVAKVHRDKLMKRLHKKYPRYDFIHNVGYGTRKHIKAIKKYGLSPIHRKSFKVH